MKDKKMTMAQLIEEMTEMRRRLAELDKSEAEHKRIEQAFRDGEEKFGKFAEITEDLIIIMDLAGIITYVNPAVLSFLGGLDIVGMTATAFFPPELNDTYQKMLDDRLKGFSERRAFEWQVTLPTDASIRHIDFRTSPLTQMGKPSGVFCIARDITDRKRAEALAIQNEDRYRTILEEMEDGYQEVDLAGNFTFFNESFLKIFGYTEKEMMGTNYRLYAADAAIAERVYRAYNQMYKTGVPIKKFEWDIIRKDGARRTIEFFASLLRDPDGRPTGFRGVVRDATDRKREEEQYRIVANSSPVGVYIVQDGVIRFANPHIARYSGYPESELIGARIWEFVHPDDRETVREKARNMLRVEAATPYEYRIIDRENRVRWHMETVTPISYRGRRAVLGNTMDITEQKRLDEERRRLEAQLLQAQKMESIGTLAGGIAHDFNNLLMGIQGYASLMLMELDECHPHYEKLQAIEKQVQSGADLTRQLLGFARGGRYEVKPTDLNDLIARTAAMFGRTKKEIRIHEKYCEGIRIVDADRGQMDQVLLNLCVNAWQAMPGGGDLFLETDNVNLDAVYVAPYDTKPGPYVKVSVTDTGVGMDENIRQRIFDPFFTTREMGRGTGLGLASAYGIIKGHGGFINVYSEKGHGTTFNIYLPASNREVVREEQPAGTIRRGHETVLVVDDERMILDVTQEMLKGLGYRVLVAQSGADAIEVYRADHEKIDLVILDMIMPGMGGGDVLDRMKIINADCRVILSSGYSINGEARTIMARGARLFLQKPFRLDDLSQKIREALGDRKELFQSGAKH